MHLWIQCTLSIKKDYQHGDSLAKCLKTDSCYQLFGSDVGNKKFKGRATLN
jgi:hypothetical protein